MTCTEWPELVFHPVDEDWQRVVCAIIYHPPPWSTHLPGPTTSLVQPPPWSNHLPGPTTSLVHPPPWSNHWSSQGLKRCKFPDVLHIDRQTNTLQWRTFTVTLSMLQEKGDFNGGRGRIQTPAFSTRTEH